MKRWVEIRNEISIEDMIGHYRRRAIIPTIIASVLMCRSDWTELSGAQGLPLIETTTHK